jgi:diacylglycerol O-acyltransferase
VFDLVSPKILEMLRLREGRSQPRPETPISCFNGDIDSERGFVFGSLPLDDIKTVKNAFDASVNDVLLAVISTALRDYLRARDALPELSLRTGLPVSLRGEDDEEISNRVTQVSVTLATDVADPVARLQAISEDCEQAKQLVHAGGKGFIELIQVMPPLMVSAMMASTSPEQTAQMLGSNLIVSNVHGSDKPMYVAGARLETMYPMSIITPGMGINFTCVSYTGQVDVGVTIAPQLVPDPWEIIDGLYLALEEYLALAAKAARRRKSRRKSTTGSRAKPAQRKRAPAKSKASATKTKTARSSGAAAAATRKKPVSRRKSK